MITFVTVAYGSKHIVLLESCKTCTFVQLFYFSFIADVQTPAVKLFYFTFILVSLQLCGALMRVA